MPSCSLTRRFAFLLYVVSATGAFAPVAAAPDVLSDINTVRTTTCGKGTPGPALQVSPAVTSAAQRVARGSSPEDALLAGGHVAQRLGSIPLEGHTDAGQIRQ